MTEQITLEEALKLVSFYHGDAKEWVVLSVHGNVGGNVYGNVGGDIVGDVKGNVYGNVGGDVEGGIGGNVEGNIYGAVNGDIDGGVKGTIKHRRWKFVETPKEKLHRLIEQSGNQELMEAFNQMEDNS